MFFPKIDENHVISRIKISNNKNSESNQKKNLEYSQ